MTSQTTQAAPHVAALLAIAGQCARKIAPDNGGISLEATSESLALCRG